MVILGIWLAVVGYAIAYAGVQSIKHPDKPMSLAQALGLPQAAPGVSSGSAAAAAQTYDPAAVAVSTVSAGQRGINAGYTSNTPTNPQTGVPLGLQP